MKMAGFYDESISNGLGWRAVLFVSGCPHHCPGCHNKQAEVVDFIKDVKKIKPNFNIWCYTGYTMEELEKRQDAITQEALNEIDILVDEEFKEAQKDPSLKFRGSKNQKIIDIKKTKKVHKVIELAI